MTKHHLLKSISLEQIENNNGHNATDRDHLLTCTLKFPSFIKILIWIGRSIKSGQLYQYDNENHKGQNIWTVYTTNQRENDKRLIDIHKRHLTSKVMIEDSIEQVKNRIWDVTSSCGDDKYRVTIENKVCPENCRLRYNDWNICVYSH